MSELPKLKPCPCCGGEAKYEVFMGNGFVLPRVQWHKIECTSCKLGTDVRQYFGNERTGDSTQHNIWNKRDAEIDWPEEHFVPKGQGLAPNPDRLEAIYQHLKTKMTIGEIALLARHLDSKIAEMANND